MTEEKLNQYKELLSKVSQWPWHALELENNNTGADRIDIYTGPEVVPSEVRAKLESQGKGPMLVSFQNAFEKEKNSIVCHMHTVLSKNGWFEQSVNAPNDAAFILKTPEIVSELIAEIERLKNGK